MDNVQIELGDRVKDRITNLKGIAIGVTNWLYGCKRIVVQPEEAKDGKPAETFCVDAPQLEVLKKGVVSPPQAAPSPSPRPSRHGPMRDPGRRDDLTR